MPQSLNTLLEGSPAYGVLDARDGVVLFRRNGHEAAFDAVAAEAMEAASDGYVVIPLTDEEQRLDRLFIAPLDEERSFAP